MDQFIATALTWIALQLGYTGALPPPKVTLIADEQLQSMAAAAIPRAGQFVDQQAGGFAGLYLSDGRTVYLPRGFDVADQTDRAVLVHELVHYVQDLSGKTNLPDSALESQAYDIEYRWRDEAAATMPVPAAHRREATEIENRGAGETGSRETKTFALRPAGQ